VAGLLVTAAPDAARDSYAISAERLRLAWPKILGARWQPSGARRAEELTILHVSDLRFDREQPPGEGLGLLPADLAGLARPDLLVITGNLATQGLRSEFHQAMEFAATLAEEAEIPRRHVVIVPGNHDVNRRACKAYFEEQESDEKKPVPHTGRSGGSSPRSSATSTRTLRRSRSRRTSRGRCSRWPTSTSSSPG
jgi:predicted MPP superfamily phosphohydrolase